MAEANERVAAVMADLTARVVASIEAGIADPNGWTPPWHNVTGGATNAVTKRRYSGGNWLWLTIIGQGPWATYKQWESVGAQVRKGEKGTPILAPIPVKFQRENSRGETENVAFTRFRTANVFHAGQVDGWTAPAVPANAEPRIAEAEAWLAEWSKVVTVVNAPNRAFYSLTEDRISIPAFEEFKDAEGFYATIFHEAVHSTAHPSRLNREFGTFGSPVYAKEELVAELGSAYLGQHFGVATELSSHNADYLANWTRALKGDTSLLWDAASAASKAVSTLLAVAPVAAEAVTLAA
jgi:antirestriction protein ArdC